MPTQRSQRLLLLFCLATFSVILSASAQQPSEQVSTQMITSPCSDIQCQNGGICVLGGSILASEQVAVGDAHCACQPGWTGLTCDEPFDSCSDASPCQNNGACLLGLRDDYGNIQNFCDCNNALDENGSKVVGKWCEHQAVTYCDGQGSFCINGECNPDYLTTSDGLVCLCADGYGGPHCEFQKGEVPNCNLDCHNGGHCIMGETVNTADVYHFWDTSENQQDMMHCKCKDDYDGPLCEHEKSVCGDGHCFNGSTCVEKIGTDGMPHYHCDCNSANTDQVSFAGRFCQYASTETCASSQNTEGPLFCVNNGHCKEDAFEGCDCPPGFSGFSCEFRVDIYPSSTISRGNQTEPEQSTDRLDPGNSMIDDPDYIDCDLTCQNGGRCRKGEKVSNLGDIAQDIEYLNQTSNVDFEHCVCQPGFAGLQCEIEISVCGDVEHVCLHGSKCVKDGEFHACDCSQGDGALAGTFCEHKASASGICTSGELMPGKPLSFCVNGGVCKEQVKHDEPHPGCDCTDGWTGPHCELRISSEDPWSPSTAYDEGQRESSSTVPLSSSSSSSSRGLLVVEIIFLVLCLVLLAAVLLFGLSKHVQNKRRQVAGGEDVSFVNAQEPYRDERNISPHRDSMMDPFPSRFRSSSSDPFFQSETTRRASRAQETLEPVEIC